MGSQGDRSAMPTSVSSASIASGAPAAEPGPDDALVAKQVAITGVSPNKLPRIAQDTAKAAKLGLFLVGRLS